MTDKVKKPTAAQKTMLQVLVESHQIAKQGWHRWQVLKKKDIAFYDFMDDVIRAGLKSLGVDKD